MTLKTTLVMEANWFGRAATTLEQWGTPDAVELRRETETLDAASNVIDESGEVLKNLPAMLPESEWAEVLSDSQNSELDHTRNRCLRVRLRKNFMSKIHVLARYVHVPAWTAAGKPLNFDLSRSANPSHMDVSVESLASEVEALAWFASQDDHSGACIFPLASLTPADRARVRRAMARRQA